MLPQDPFILPTVGIIWLPVDLSLWLTLTAAEELMVLIDGSKIIIN